MRGLRSKLTFANVCSFLALLIALGTGGVYAANTVFSGDIVNNEVYGADVRDDTLAGGGLGHVDLKAGSVRSSEVGANSLTGADIKDNSGVNTCPAPATLRFGAICAGVADEHHTWYDASDLCTNLELRLPSYGEARSLAKYYDLPSLDENEYFWTEETWVADATFYARIVADGGGASVDAFSNANQDTVCVTTPTN
jgi:hypothetical protein